jgi:hypothetical protein
MPDIDRAVSRLVVPREGGGWDYYPFGFTKAGYRVDHVLLEESLRIERSGSQRALLGIGIIALLLYIVLPNLALTHPALTPLANSPIIRLALAIPLVALVYFLVMARRRMLLRAVLLDRMAKSPPLAPADILARRASQWRATPWFSRIAIFSCLPLGALALALYAAQRLSQMDALAGWESGLAAALAVGLVALYGFVIYRVLTFQGAGRADR